MAQAESSLGDAITLVQDIRQLVVNAGNGANTPADRRTIANQILSLREQLLSVANRKDTNGLPLFNGLGSALAPFLGPPDAGPTTPSRGPARTDRQQRRLDPLTLDGDAAFMFRPQRDGVYHAAMSTIPNTRQFGTDAVNHHRPGPGHGRQLHHHLQRGRPGRHHRHHHGHLHHHQHHHGHPQPPVTVPDFPPTNRSPSPSRGYRA